MFISAIRANAKITTLYKWLSVYMIYVFEFNAWNQVHKLINKIKLVIRLNLNR
jgi:hypothetical protein